MLRTLLRINLLFGLFISVHTAQAQNQYLNFYPWVNGATTGTMTSDANPDQFGAKTGCITGDVTASISGGAWTATYPKWTNTTPATWSSSFGYELNVNWTTTNQTSTMVVDFKKSAALIELPIEFFIADINAAACASTAANRFIDVVTIVGYKSNLATVVYPTLVTVTCAGNSVGGANNNVISGNPNCGSNAQGARVQFSPTDKIARLVITYSSGTGYPVNLAACAPYPLNAGEDPKSQYIRVSSIKLNYDCATSTILPVELKEFDASCADNGAVSLNWKTESERDNAYFTVLRSVNGSDFEPIAKITGAGTTAEEQTYQFIDEEDLAGIRYYRLSQTDFSGLTYLHTIRSIDPTCNAFDELISVFPQPVDDEMQLQFHVSRPEDVNLTLTNSLGETLQQIAFEVAPNAASQSLDVSHLAAGTYFLSGQIGTKMVSVKLIKL